MKRYIVLSVVAIVLAAQSFAQSSNISKGFCGKGLEWTFDGRTLTLTNVTKDNVRTTMTDYKSGDKTPWAIAKLAVKRVRVGKGIDNIGSCAFANCDELTEVVFDGNGLQTIGWGAFMNCRHLRNITFPGPLRNIEPIAFANCSALAAISILGQCHVEDQAFLNCTGVKDLEIGNNVQLGQYVFACEVTVDGKIHHTLYDGEIRRLPGYVNVNNCHNYGLTREAVGRFFMNRHGVGLSDNYDVAIAQLDSVMPKAVAQRSDTYALVIGNQDYRFVSDVHYAVHDARIFRNYCETVLGLPTENIHLCEDATKYLLDEEVFLWLSSISQPENKKLIVYFAGLGIADTKDGNKPYLLPTDVRGMFPSHGISLESFYERLGKLSFMQSVVFVDASFNGINRDDESISYSMRDEHIVAAEASPTTGNVVTITASRGNEYALGYREQGHGLFTYYLLNELHLNSGVVSLGMLADNIKNNVSQNAMQYHQGHTQTPVVKVSPAFADQWRDARF